MSISIELIDSTGDVGKFSSLALVNDVLSVSYYDASKEGLKYATRQGDDDWITEIVESKSGAEPLSITEFSNFSTGRALSFFGDWVVVGNNIGTQGTVYASGVVEIYRKLSSNNLTLIKTLTAPKNNGEKFGTSVSIYGEFLAVGATNADENGSEDALGAVYIYSKDEGGEDNWGLVKTIKRPFIQGSGRVSNFGYSVSLNEDKLIIGASLSNVLSDQTAGRIFIAEASVSNGDYIWPDEPQHTLYASNKFPGALFGHSVGIEGDWAVVGAPNASSSTVARPGQVYILKRDSSTNTWNHLKILSPETTAYERDDYFGFGVAISEGLVAAVSRNNKSGDSFAAKLNIFEKDEGGTENWGEVFEYESSELDRYEYVDISNSLVITSGRGYASVFKNTGTWSLTETLEGAELDNPDSTFGRNISIDSSGSGHFVVTSTNGFMYLYESAESSGSVGTYSQLLDIDGQPGIFYHDSVVGSLKYAKYNGSDWDIEIVDIDSVGTYISAVIDSNNKVTLAYHDYGNGNLKVAQRIIGTDEFWTIETVDDVAATVGLYASVALDGTIPSIAYYDSTNKNLKYANFNTTTEVWEIATVDSTGTVGEYASLAFINSKANIVYYDDTNARLKRAELDGTWSVSVLRDTIDSLGKHTSLVSLNDQLYATYFNETMKSLERVYVDVSGSIEARELDDGAHSAVGYFNSTVVGSDNTIYTTNYDDSAEDLFMVQEDFLVEEDDLDLTIEASLAGVIRSIDSTVGVGASLNMTISTIVDLSTYLGQSTQGTEYAPVHGGKWYYAQNKPGYTWYDEVDNATGWTVDFNLEVFRVENSDGFSTIDKTEGLGIYVNDGTYKEVIYFFEQEIVFNNAKKSFTIDTTQETNYRLIGKGGSLKLFYRKATDLKYKELAAVPFLSPATNEGNATKPAISQDSNGTLHAAWNDDGNGLGQVYYSENKSGSWSLPVKIASSPFGVHNVDIASDGTNVYVAFETREADGSDIGFVAKTNLGWGSQDIVSTGVGYAKNPKLSIAIDRNVHVVWEDDRLGQSDIFCAMRIRETHSWLPPQRVSDSDLASVRPSISIYREKSYISWTELEESEYDFKSRIQIRYFNAMSNEWSQIVDVTDLTNENADYSDVNNFTDGKVMIVWHDNRAGQYDIYARILDSELEKTDDIIIRLTDSPLKDAQFPAISRNIITDDMYVAWQDDRHDTTSIFVAKYDNENGHWLSETQYGYSLYIATLDDRQAFQPAVAKEFTGELHILYESMHISGPSEYISTDLVFSMIRDAIYDLSYNIQWNKALIGYLSSDINECSGIAVSRDNPNYIYAIDDDISGLFILNKSDGSTVYQWTSMTDLSFAFFPISAVDIEDICVGPWTNNSGVTNNYVFIADTGDNAENNPRRSTILLYVASETAALTMSGGLLILDEHVTLTFTDTTARNVESIFVDPSDQTLYMVTKNENIADETVLSPHKAEVWGIPLSEIFTGGITAIDLDQETATAGGNSSYRRVLIDENTPGGLWINDNGVSAADMSADGSKIIMRDSADNNTSDPGYEHQAMMWHRKRGETVEHALKRRPVPVPLPNETDEPKGEAIAFDPDSANYAYYSTGEKNSSPLTPKLYKFTPDDTIAFLALDDEYKERDTQISGRDVRKEIRFGDFSNVLSCRFLFKNFKFYLKDAVEPFDMYPISGRSYFTDDFGVSNSVVNDIGNAWVGSLCGLKFYYNNDNSLFEVNDNIIKSLAFGPDNILFIASTNENGNGLIQYSNDHRTFKNLLTIEGFEIKEIAISLDNKLFVGLDGQGVSIYKISYSDNDVVVELLDTLSDELPSLYINAIQIDESNVAWIGTRSGLVRYQNGRVNTYTTRGGLSSNYINDIAIRNNAIRYIATSNGINKMIGTSFEHIMSNGGKIANNNVKSVAWQEPNIVWAGTLSDINQILDDAGEYILNSYTPDFYSLYTESVDDRKTFFIVTEDEIDENSYVEVYINGKRINFGYEISLSNSQYKMIKFETKLLKSDVVDVVVRNDIRLLTSFKQTEAEKVALGSNIIRIKDITTNNSDIYVVTEGDENEIKVNDSQSSLPSDKVHLDTTAPQGCMEIDEIVDSDTIRIKVTGIKEGTEATDGENGSGIDTMIVSNYPNFTSDGITALDPVAYQDTILHNLGLTSKSSSELVLNKKTIDSGSGSTIGRFLNGDVYAGFSKPAKIFKLNNSTGDWDLTLSFDSDQYVEFIEEYNGKIIIGVGHDFADAKIYIYEDDTFTNPTVRSLTGSRAYSAVEFNGLFYIGSGDDGTLYSFDGSDLKVSLTGLSSHIYSLSSSKSDLFAGTGNSGKLYRVLVDDSASLIEHIDTDEAISAIGTYTLNGKELLFVGVSEEGKILRTGVQDSSFSKSFQTTPSKTSAIKSRSDKLYAAVGKTIYSLSSDAIWIWEYTHDENIIDFEITSTGIMYVVTETQMFQVGTGEEENDTSIKVYLKLIDRAGNETSLYSDEGDLVECLFKSISIEDLTGGGAGGSYINENKLLELDEFGNVVDSLGSDSPFYSGDKIDFEQGVYHSEVFNGTNDLVKWDKLLWTATQPEDTTVEIYVRTGTSSTGVLSKDWVGPYSIESSSGVDIGFLSGQYLQFKAVLTSRSSGITPTLSNVTIKTLTSDSTHFFTTNFVLPSRLKKGILTSQTMLPVAADVVFGINTTDSVDWADYQVIDQNRLFNVNQFGENMRVGIKLITPSRSALVASTFDEYGPYGYSIFINTVDFNFINTSGSDKTYEFRISFYNDQSLSDLVHQAYTLDDADGFSINGDDFPSSGKTLSHAQDVDVLYSIPSSSGLRCNEFYYVKVEAYDGSSFTTIIDDYTYISGCSPSFIDTIEFDFTNTLSTRYNYDFRIKFYEDSERTDLFKTVFSGNGVSGWTTNNSDMSSGGFLLFPSETVMVGYSPDISDFDPNKVYYLTIDAFNGSNFILASNAYTFQVNDSSTLIYCGPYSDVPVVKNFALMFELLNNEQITLNIED